MESNNVNAEHICDESPSVSPHCPSLESARYTGSFPPLIFLLRELAVGIDWEVVSLQDLITYE